MVYLIAKDVSLCLLLDHLGDPTVVQPFVTSAWDVFHESQSPSLLQQARWLRGKMASEIPNDDLSTQTALDVETLLRTGTSLSKAVSRLTVQMVTNRLRNAPSHGGTSSGERYFQCTSAEELWIVKRLTQLVRRAVAAQVRHVMPRQGVNHRGDFNQKGSNRHQEGVGSTPNGDNMDFDHSESESNGDDDDVFPHDSVVLVPVHLCRMIDGMTLRQVVQLCWANNSHSVTFIINPAVSPAGNVFRRQKNKRLDGIRHTVLEQQYKVLARPGGGAHSVHSHFPSQQEDQSKESFASFIRDASIGFDMQVMALSGGAVGYYVAYVRGLSTNVCIVYGIIGLIAMLFVDAILFIARVGRMDEQTRKDKKRMWRAWHPRREHKRKIDATNGTASEKVDSMDNNAEKAALRAKKEV